MRQMQTSNYGYEKTVGGRKMKPIIIIKETNKEGKFELTEEELKELVEQAYDQGFENAKEQYQPKLNPSWQTRTDITPCKFTPGNYVTDKPCTSANPHDVFGNPLISCGGGTASDPRDNKAVLSCDIKLNGAPVSNGI